MLAANAGLRSAALNVFINAKAIKDRDFAEKQIAEVNALLAQAAESDGIGLSDSQNQDRLVISHASWRGLYCVERKNYGGSGRYVRVNAQAMQAPDFPGSIVGGRGKTDY